MSNEQGNNKYSIDKISEEEKRVQEFLKERQEKTTDGGCFDFIFIGPALIFLIASMVMFVIGVYMSVSYLYNKKQCTDHVIGTVESIETSIDSSYDFDNQKRRDTTLYKPVFGYTYNGIHHVKSYSFESDTNSYNEGDEIDIYVDPDDAEHIFIPSYSVYPITGILFIVFGGLVVAVELVFILSIKGKKKKKVKHSNIENEYDPNDDYRG